MKHIHLLMTQSMDDRAEIENIVAAVNLADSLDLELISRELEGAEYNPQVFPGLIYHLKEPKTGILLFASGKSICTGNRSLVDVNIAIKKVIKNLKEIGVSVYEEPEITVQNIVAVYDLKCKLNLTTIAITFELERVEYEPEQFPGLVYRLIDPKVVVLLFGSGKVVLTGANNIEQINQAVKKLKKDLSDANFLY